MRNGKLKNLCLCALFSALSAAGAFLRIPAFPVPVTLQFLFALLSGMLLGGAWGALSQGLYLLLGLAGLPVFSMGGGPGYLLQPTFGFLLGLIPAAWLSGYLFRRKPARFVHGLFAALVAWLIMYAVGLPWFHVSLRLSGSPQRFGVSLLQGCLVFLPGDILKILTASLLCSKLRRIL